MSPDFEYHSVPLPWTQIKMLQILAVLGKDDLNISKRMYEVLDICLAKANLEVGQLIGKALIFECVRTISSIYPESELIRKSACVVGKFLSSPSNNIKYFGITALSLLVQVSHYLYLTTQLTHHVQNCSHFKALSNKWYILCFKVFKKTLTPLP